MRDRLIPALAAALVAGQLAMFLLPGRESTADHVAFQASGRAALAGADPYATGRMANLNPPLSLLAFAALADADPRAAYLGLAAVSLCAYVALVALLWRAYPPRLRPATTVALLVAAGPFWGTVQYGQVYVVLALPVVGAWLLLRAGRRVPAGLLIGCAVALKPNLAVWPLLLALAGAGAVALAALAVALLLAALPLLAYGPGVYRDWLAILPGPSLADGANGSLAALAAHWGGPPALGTALAAALVLAAAVVARRRKPGPLAASALGLVVALLAGPIAWPSYAILLLPVAFAVGWSPPVRVAAALLCVPEFALQLAAAGPVGRATLGQLTGLAFLLLLVAVWPRAISPAPSWPAGIARRSGCPR